MARLILAIAATLLPWACLAQGAEDQQFKAAGVCARCHVISVVEWGMSRHSKVGTTCTSCHGASQGHVADERNNVKPDRNPQGAAIARMCVECHVRNIPKTGEPKPCQGCHNVHALVNPAKPPVVKDERIDNLSARWERYGALMSEGERLVKTQQWDAARSAFRRALGEKPGDARAAARAKMCERRLNPQLPGFEVAGMEYDAETGLPREVRVAGLGIAMVLVPGGEFEMGSDRFKAATPIHTVRVGPFYLAKYETTQAEWKALMGSNPSAHQGAKFPDAARMPVEQVSWEDAQALVRKLNERVPGAAFRLPAEAEWELAARAGAAPPNTGELPAPKPVGAGKPNRLGLFDMQGNVWEWCSSLYRPYPYSESDGREDGAAPGLRVLRGGGFADPPEWSDPGARHGERPNRRLRWNGVRLARGIPGER